LQVFGFFIKLLLSLHQQEGDDRGSVVGCFLIALKQK